MKESLNRNIDWSNPENHAEQHKTRYEDQLVHAAFTDPTGPRHFSMRDGSGFDKLTPNELGVIRNKVIFDRRQNYIAAGGSAEVADQIISAGNDMVGAPPNVADIRTVRFSRKIP